MPPTALARFVAFFTLAACMTVMAASAADAELVTTYWKLVSVRGMEVPESSREAHIVMGPDGRLSGNTGCNLMKGTYEVDGQALTFGPILTTRMFCREVAASERALIHALPLVARWSTTGDRLELLSESGVSLAVFQAVYS